MDSQNEVKSEPLLGWHDIIGSPYLLREEDKDRFRIVISTSTILYDNGYGLYSTLDKNHPELILGKNIEEFFPDNLQLGFLIDDENPMLDRQMVRGLRHFARLENAFYVSYQLINRGYGEPVPFFDKTLILPRFFNRKSDSRIRNEIDPQSVKTKS